jgi:CheY-like chemotaxis protein
MMMQVQASPPRITARILLTDDDDTLRSVTMRAIRRAHPEWEVGVASSGDEALLAVTTAAEELHPFDCVLLDQSMPPGPTGAETALRIRENTSELVRSVPIVGLTGYTDGEDVAAFFAAGAFEVLAKPFDRDALVHTIAAAINRHRAELAQQRKAQADAHE